MGLFGQMKAAVGVGAADVLVALEKGNYHWNETIRGRATIKGGQTEQNIGEFKVVIVESWMESTRDMDGDRHNERKYRYYGQRVLATQIVATPNSQQQWDFEVQLPGEGMLSHDWSVQATASVAGAVDRHGSYVFKLLPSAGVMGLVNALYQVLPCTVNSMSNNSTQVSVDFKPPVAHQTALDGLMLIVQDDGNSVNGVLEVNPQEKSFADRIKALTKSDRVKYPIAFPAAPLAAAADGTGPAPAEVIARLRELIQPHLS